MENLEDIYPLSPMQRLYYAVGDSHAATAMAQLRYELSGPLEVAALEAAFARIFQRHPIFRTVFVSEGADDPLQVVHASVHVPLSQHDLRAFSPEEQDERMAAFLAADGQRRFDLATLPLMRLALFRLREESWQLIWTHARLLIDGWSLALTWNEVSACYEAIRTKRELPLEPVSPYRDYIAWLQKLDTSEAEAAWRKALDGFTRPTTLGVDRSLPVGTNSNAGFERQQIRLSAAETAAIHALARERQLTLNTLVQGAWALLLSLYCGEQDVVFGFTVSGRPAELPGVESMVGMFTNNLPMRVPIPLDAPLIEWLEQLQERQFAIRRYEHTALPQIQKWSEVPWHQRLFDSLVVFQHSTEFAQERLGTEVTVRELTELLATNYSLTLMAIPGLELSLWMLYDGRRFEAATIARVLRHLTTLIEGMIARPSRRVGDLLDSAPLTPDEEADDRTRVQRTVSTLSRTYVAPRSVLEFKLTQILENGFRMRPIGVTDNFFELGGYSLLAVRLFEEIERTFGKRLPLATIFQAPTVEQLAHVLSLEGWSAPWSSLVAIKPGGSRPPLFCAHAGGGHVLFYRDLAQRLGPDQPFYGLQLPLDAKQAPYLTRVEDMAAHYIREIRDLQPQGPYYLGGASFGGLVAYEIAQQLVAQGQEVALTALFDAFAPGYPRFLPGTSAVRSWTYDWYQVLRHHAGSLWMLKPRDKWPYLVAKLSKARRGLRVNRRKKVKALVRAVLKTMGRPLPPLPIETEHAIGEAHANYLLRPYPGRLTLFRAATQPLGIYPDPTLGWGELALGGMEIHEVPGFHGAIVSEPRVRFTAERLRECMDRILADEAAHNPPGRKPAGSLKYNEGERNALAGPQPLGADRGSGSGR